VQPRVKKEKEKQPEALEGASGLLFDDDSLI
jgi:hypothetical protein